MTSQIETASAAENGDLERKLQATAVSHSILSLVPYDTAIEYFAFPMGVDSRGRIARVPRTKCDIKVPCGTVFLGPP